MSNIALKDDYYNDHYKMLSAIVVPIRLLEYLNDDNVYTQVNYI